MWASPTLADLLYALPRIAGATAALHCRLASAEQDVQRCSQRWLQSLAAAPCVWASATSAALRYAVPRIVGMAAAPHCRLAPAEQALQRCLQSWLQSLAAVPGVWASPTSAALPYAVPRIAWEEAAVHCWRAPAEQALQRCSPAYCVCRLCSTADWVLHEGEHHMFAAPGQ